MMIEKTKIKLDTLISKFPNDIQNFFRELSEYAISLGYNPKFNDKITYADFIKSKHGKTIMKISEAYKPSEPPRLNIRFDGLPMCCGIFQKAAEYSNKLRMECNRCNECKGIKYTLSSGSEIIGLCQAIRYIPSYSVENIPEIKDALKMQDEFLMSLISK